MLQEAPATPTKTANHVYNQGPTAPTMAFTPTKPNLYYPANWPCSKTATGPCFSGECSRSHYFGASDVSTVVT